MSQLPPPLLNNTNNNKNHSKSDFQFSVSTIKNLNTLANDLSSGKNVLFVTGAGLSVASGISTYRSEKGSVWNNFVLEWGTRKMFTSNELKWYNEFWLHTHERPEYYTAKPNAGHYAIAHICQLVHNARVITQNVDRLHSKTSLKNNTLVEVHGRLGLYKCYRKNCRYSQRESIGGIELERDCCPKKGTKFTDGNLVIEKTPMCPNCKAPCLPQVLLFDELYESHDFYQWHKCLKWIDEADVIIFVGTSMSVGVTQEIIGRVDSRSNQNGKQKMFYNFNVTTKDCVSFCGGRNKYVKHILGPCEKTLPELYRKVLKSSKLRTNSYRLWCYPPVSIRDDIEQEEKAIEYSKKNRGTS